eukprot:7027318-Pyramimonas_sp.AAC.1
MIAQDSMCGANCATDTTFVRLWEFQRSGVPSRVSKLRCKTTLVVWVRPLVIGLFQRFASSAGPE